MVKYKTVFGRWKVLSFKIYRKRWGGKMGCGVWKYGKGKGGVIIEYETFGFVALNISPLMRVFMFNKCYIYHQLLSHFANYSL